MNDFNRERARAARVTTAENYQREQMERLASANVHQQEATVLEQAARADLDKAKAFVWNATGLILSTGLVGGLVWIATHLEVVFG